MQGVIRAGKQWEKNRTSNRDGIESKHVFMSPHRVSNKEKDRQYAALVGGFRSHRAGSLGCVSVRNVCVVLNVGEFCL